MLLGKSHGTMILILCRRDFDSLIDVVGFVLFDNQFTSRKAAYCFLFRMLNETLDGEKLSLKNNRESDTFMERTPESSSQTMPLHSSSQSLPLKTYPYLVRPQEVLRWQPIIHLAWILHVLLTVAVLCSGMQRNQDTR
jgi:hypothetical protein